MEWNGKDRQLAASDTEGSGGRADKTLAQTFELRTQNGHWQKQGALSGKISPMPTSYKTWCLARQPEPRRYLISQVQFSITFQKKKKKIKGSRRGTVGIPLKEKQTAEDVCKRRPCTTIISYSGATSVGVCS